VFFGVVFPCFSGFFSRFVSGFFSRSFVLVLRLCFWCGFVPVLPRFCLFFVCFGLFFLAFSLVSGTLLAVLLCVSGVCFASRLVLFSWGCPVGSQLLLFPVVSPVASVRSPASVWCSAHFSASFSCVRGCPFVRAFCCPPPVLRCPFSGLGLGACCVSGLSAFP
jgi:hypothetical protein